MAAVIKSRDHAEKPTHYQPQIRLSGGAVVGAETLLRWNHPQRGLIPPGLFVEALAQSPFALEVGNSVLNIAYHTAAGWQQPGRTSIRVGVNPFPAQFYDQGLVLELEGAPERSRLPAELLELEITENIAFGKADFVLATLSALRSRGVGLSFDDFGTGYASLSYPLARVRIDRSFVQNISKRSPQEVTAVVHSMIVMAHNLGFDVVAEGVETADQANFLQAKRSDEVQGYLYSKPLPPEEFEQFLRDYKIA